MIPERETRRLYDRAYMAKYKAISENRAKINEYAREYSKRPEQLAKRRERRRAKKREARRLYDRIYMAQYRPTNKEKLKKHQDKYCSKPEVKARKRAYMAAYRQAHKEQFAYNQRLYMERKANAA